MSSSPLRHLIAFMGRTALVLGMIAVVLPPAAGGAEADPAFVLSSADESLLDDLQQTAFRFFDEQTHPETGLVRDRARADGSPSEGKASIAASGFAFSAWAIATERGWVTRDAALARVRLMLRFLVERAPRQHGFFYHFMEMETGERAWQCELSSIDTTLCLAGALVAREYFQDPEITALVNQMSREIDWPWFLNGGVTPSLGWHDEHGFSRYRWRDYAEHLLMHLLGLGAPEGAFGPETWHAWAREPVGTYAGYTYLQQGPLFIHQFSQAYFDLRDRRDAFADYHHNSVLATLAQRQFSIDLQPEFPLWGARLWGVTASDSATGYKAWGGPPRTSQFNALDGTVVPCAPAGSLPLAPEETLRTLHHMRTAYGEHIWQRYGFVDAFNPHVGWINSDVIGIDVGISMIQAENLRTGLIWSLFMQAPEAQRGIVRAGLLSTRRDVVGGEFVPVRVSAQRVWGAVRDTAATPANAGLLLTAAVAAHALEFTERETAIAQVRTRLTGSEPAPDEPEARAEWMAALLTARQRIPELHTEISARIEDLTWPTMPPDTFSLGSAARLRAFLQVAREPRDPTPWTLLSRPGEAQGQVFVLAPARAADQLIPGLWIDERAIVTGASASQLAYDQLATRSGAGLPPDVTTMALWLDGFPHETLPAVATVSADESWLEAAPVRDQAVWLITVANLLAADSPRAAFQRDPLVVAARAAIPEFGAAAFGPNTSVIWQGELAGPPVSTPVRETIALPVQTPRAQWIWTTLAGLEFKDSGADVRPGDPPVEMRFAFTWDQTHLNFHAEVVDSPAGFKFPPERRRWVELMIDGLGDGLAWGGAGDLQFLFPVQGPIREAFHAGRGEGKVRRTRTGYTVAASIPWERLGLQPRSGLEVRVAPAVVAQGTREWESTLKLTWRYHRRADGRADLGVVKLQ